MKITTAMYNDLTNETCIKMIDRKGVLVDEVVIFGFIRIKIFSLHNFYVQAVYNNNNESLLEIKALITQDDWQPYLETLDLKEFFNLNY